jgi:hypothetical protein
VPAGLITFPSSAKIYRDPLGMTLIISQCNYPLQLSLIPWIGKIAGRNCAKLKLSELASATEKIISKADFAPYILLKVRTIFQILNFNYYVQTNYHQKISSKI